MDVVGASITGKPRRRPRWQPIAVLALVALGVGYGVWKGEWHFLIYATWGSINLFTSYRPPTEITAEGIRRPWRRPGQVSWADVTGVLAPRPGLSGMRLQLADGRKVPLDDIPGDRTAAVAAIGGKEVVRPAWPVVPRPPPRAPGTRTDQEVLADVTRKAAALARQRQELAEQSRRLRPL